MKQFYLFLLNIFFSVSIFGQIDSVKVTLYESNEEYGGWEFQTLYADSFSNGLQIFRLTQSWGNNSWINSQLDSYSYDTAGNVLQKVTSLWSNQWVNYRKWVYIYQGNNILTLTMQNWDGNSWIDST